ncbi:MAG: TolC family protein [Candidatus Delongbacteria bacterium]
MRTPIRLAGLLLALALATAGDARADRPPNDLSLPSFLQLAWTTNQRPAAARSELEAALAAQAQARALRGPTLGLEVTGGWVSRTQSLEMPGRSIEFGDGSTVDAALQAGWTLYAGGALEAGERRAASEALARREEQIADSLRLSAELRAAFLSALAAESIRAAAELGVSRLERLQSEVNTRLAEGTTGEEAMLLVESRLAQARQEFALRDGDARAARLELGALIGKPGAAVIPKGELETPLEGVEAGARRLATLAALDARLRAGEALVGQLGAWRRPRVEAGAGWHLARPGVDPIRNDWMGYASANLRVKWSLWDNRLGQLRQAEARSQRKALEHRLREAERETGSLLERCREWVGAALTAWDEAVAREALETRRQGLVEARWRLGMATERDWLDAQDDLRQAQLDRALGAARLRLAENRLLQAMGR